MKAGLNLFSIRGCITTEEDFLKACLKLKDIGYDYLQCSAMKLSVDQIKKVSEQTGLSVKLTHSPLDRILNDTDTLVKEHDLLRCDFIGLGAMDFERIKTEEGAKEAINTLENIAKNLKSKGKKFVYHNHNFEFIKYRNGKTFYDMLIENTKELGFVFDTYWVQMGGVNVLEYISKLKGRIDCVHLKDFKVDYMTPRFAALGDGSINFDKTISTMKKAGTKYFFVEQDDVEIYENPFNEIEKSIKYLKNIED